MLKDGILNFFKTLRSFGVEYSKESYTCGSIALNHYIKSYNKINLNLPKNISNAVRKSFFGGRCEVFGNKRGNEKVLHFDFKGMYQQCMLEELPHGNFTYKDESLDISVPGFYYVKLESYNYIPALPTRSSKLLFKSGVIEGLYWHEEIELALRVSSVKSFKVIYGFISDTNSPVLVDFINDINKIRELGGLKRELGKLLINSFYGRLGLGDELSVLSLKEGKPDTDVYGHFEDYFLVKTVLKRRPKSNVAIASAITSKARIRLYKAFLEVIRSGGRVLYCDTDSVFASFERTANVENRNLGEYVFFDTSKSDTVIKDCVFVLPKTYGVLLESGEEVIKFKGVNISSLTLSKLKSSFYSGERTLQLTSDHIKTNNMEVLYHLQKKEINIQAYDKRVWSDDYSDTRPLTSISTHIECTK